MYFEQVTISQGCIEAAPVPRRHARTGYNAFVMQSRNPSC